MATGVCIINVLVPVLYHVWPLLYLEFLCHIWLVFSTQLLFTFKDTITRTLFAVPVLLR
jgi:hypothetical protein